MCSNLFENTKIASTIVEGWIKSPGHLKNILANSDLSAVSVCYNNENNEIYFTQLFLKY